MPLSGGTSGAHDDSMHQGSAKRDVAEGLAGLDAGGAVLAPGYRFTAARGAAEQITIRERTSDERVFRFIRIGADDYEARVNVGGVEKVVQHAGLKDVVNGIAALDAAGALLVPGSKIYYTRDGSDDVHIYERTSNEEAYAFHRVGADDYTLYVKELNVWKRFQTESMKDVANGIAGLDGSGDLLLAQIPDTLTGKDADTLDGSHGAAYMKRVPDYDSGCFSVAGTTNVGKIHNLNTRDLLVRVLYCYTDSDCIHDAAAAGGYPQHATELNISRYSVSNISVNEVNVRNYEESTRYYRILIWDVC